MTESAKKVYTAAVSSEASKPLMRARPATEKRQDEGTPGEDRVLGAPIHWAAYSHRELYDALHADNEPGKAHERAREWDELAKEVESAAKELATVVRESEAGWRGDAADAGRAVMHDLSRCGEDVSRTTRGVSRYLADQADVMQRAKAEMPEPPEVSASDMNQHLIASSGSAGMIGAAISVVAIAKQRQDTTHQQAVDVMTAMETGSRQVDERTPGFNPAREGTSRVREKLEPQARPQSRLAQPAQRTGGGSEGNGSQPNVPGGPKASGAAGDHGVPDPAGQPGGGDAPAPLAAQPDGTGDPTNPGAVPGNGDPHAETKQFAALSGDTPSDVPGGGDPGAQPNSGDPSGSATDFVPEPSETPSEPSQTTSSSAGTVNQGSISSGGYSGGSQVPTTQGSGDQQHWNQLFGAYGKNSRNRSMSGSLSDKDASSPTTPEGLTGDLPGATDQPVGGVGGGAAGASVPPSSAGGAGGGGSLSPGGSAGAAPGGGGGGAPTTGGGPSGGGSGTGGMAMGGAGAAGGAGGARKGGEEDKEHQSPEYLKDQSLFEVDERPAPSVIGEKFKKKQ